MRRVEVAIDEVVVSGLEATEARHAVRALDTHLLGLLLDPATRWPAHDASVATVRPARTGGRSGAELGRATAGVIHAALQGGAG